MMFGCLPSDVCAHLLTPDDQQTIRCQPDTPFVVLTISAHMRTWLLWLAFLWNKSPRSHCVSSPIIIGMWNVLLWFAYIYAVSRLKMNHNIGSIARPDQTRAPEHPALPAPLSRRQICFVLDMLVMGCGMLFLSPFSPFFLPGAQDEKNTQHQQKKKRLFAWTGWFCCFRCVLFGSVVFFPGN